MPENSVPSDPIPPQAKSLGRATSRGISWMSFSLVVGKVCIFLAQVVLGWILTKEDFGVFAIAAIVIAFIKIFHDGGVSQVLVQRGDAEFDRLQGAMFWLAMSISTVAGLLLAAAAPWIAVIYKDDRLVPMMLVMAATLPLGAPANVLRARLQLQLRFRAISMISAARFVIRSTGMILLALWGFGVMSFVLPLLVVAVFEDVANYLATRSKPWQHPVLFREWPALLRDSNWVIIATLFKGLARNGDYLVLGLMLPKALLGLYYFGYQLTVQITFLFALNLRHVLFPVLTKVANQPARQASAIVRTIRMLMLVATPASMLIAVIIKPLEELVWHQKWIESVPLMQIFAIVSPILILTDVVHAALTSRGRFRLSAELTLLEGIWLMGSAWLAVTLAGEANLTAIAVWIFGLQVAYALVVSGWLLRSFEIPPVTFLKAFLPQWLVALAAAGVTAIVNRFLPAAAPPLVQILVLSASYLAAFAIGAWLMLRPELEELANVAPTRVATVLRKVLFLRPAGNSPGSG